MAHCPFTKCFCFSLCTVKCSLVSKWVAGATPLFLSDCTLSLILRQPCSTKLSISLSVKLLKILKRLSLLKKIQTLHLCEKRFGVHAHSIFQCSTQFHPIFLYSNKLVLWVGTFSEEKVSVFKIYHQYIFTTPWICSFFAYSICSTLQNILLQNTTELKKAERVLR